MSTKEQAIASAKHSVAASKEPKACVIYRVRNGQWLFASKKYADEAGIIYQEENIFWFHDYMNRTGWWAR